METVRIITKALLIIASQVMLAAIGSRLGNRLIPQLNELPWWTLAVVILPYMLMGCIAGWYMHHMFVSKEG